MAAKTYRNMKIVENTENKLSLEHKSNLSLYILTGMMLAFTVLIWISWGEDAISTILFLGLIGFFVFIYRINIQLDIDFVNRKISIKRYAALKFVSTTQSFNFSELRTFDITQTMKWWGIKLGFFSDRYNFTMREPTQEVLLKIQQLGQYVNNPLADALNVHESISLAKDDIPSEIIAVVEKEIRQNPETPALEIINNQMLKEISSWRNWQIGFGIFHLISGDIMSNPWGVILIIIGLGSWLFPAPAMFVVYAGTIFSAAIGNFSGNQGAWFVFSLFQFLIAYRVFMRFLFYKKSIPEIYRQMEEASDPNLLKYLRASKAFPWLGLAFGIIGVGAIVLAFISIVFISASGISINIAVANFILTLAISISGLGFAFGLASFLSNFKYRPVSIFAMVAGGLVILLRIGIIIVTLFA